MRVVIKKDNKNKGSSEGLGEAEPDLFEIENARFADWRTPLRKTQAAFAVSLKEENL